MSWTTVSHRLCVYTLYHAEKPRLVVTEPVLGWNNNNFQTNQNLEVGILTICRFVTAHN